MKSNIDKNKLGILIYYTCLILSCVSLIATIIIVGFDKDKFGACVRYDVAFYVFIVLINGSSICKEYLSEKYDKKKMIVKLIITSVILISGTIMIILFYNQTVSFLVMCCGLVGMFFNLTPSAK